MEATDKRIIEKLDQVYNEALEKAIETKFLEQFRIEGENDKDLIKRIPELCNSAINIAEDFFGCETIRISEGTFSCSFSSWRYFEIRKGFETEVKYTKTPAIRNSPIRFKEYRANLLLNKTTYKSKEQVFAEMERLYNSAIENIELAKQQKQDNLAETFTKYAKSIKDEYRRYKDADFEEMQVELDFENSGINFSEKYDENFQMYQELGFYSARKIYCEAVKYGKLDLLKKDFISGVIETYKAKESLSGAQFIDHLNSEIKECDRMLVPLCKKDGYKKSSLNRSQESAYQMYSKRKLSLSKVLEIVSKETDTPPEPEPRPEPVEVVKEMYQEKSPEIVLVQYSDRAIAVFGETYKIKDILKEFGAKFNRYLRWEGSVKPGWIMSLKAADQVRNHLQLA